jgi:uroporphyrinogen decarboxylase
MANAHNNEEMTSLERISTALQYKKPDRVPVAPLFCGASHRVLGITYDTWSLDAELATKSLLAAHEIIGFDAFVTLVDLSVEAYDFGQAVIFPKNSTGYPDYNNLFIRNGDDYLKVKYVDPLQSKRMKSVIDICGGLAKARGHDTGVIGFIYGPLGVLSQMRGHEDLFKDLIRHPDRVLEAVETITVTLVEYATEQIRAGAHSVCIDPLYSSASVLKKETWERFEGPFCRRIADAIRDAGGLVTMHNCGNGVYFDAILKWINPVAISHAYPAYGCKTWEEHAAVWGNKVVSMGHSDPAATGMEMTPEEIIEDCRVQIETFKDCDGGFILSTGCEFPPNGNLLSAIAMIKAGKIHGVYS